MNSAMGTHEKAYIRKQERTLRWSILRTEETIFPAVEI